MDGYIHIVEYDAEGNEVSREKTEFFAPRDAEEMRRLLNGEDWDTIRPNTES